jgi:hypothetical protein
LGDTHEWDDQDSSGWTDGHKCRVRELTVKHCWLRLETNMGSTVHITVLALCNAYTWVHTSNIPRNADRVIIIIISSSSSSGSSGVRLSPLGTTATTGLLYQSQMMVIVEQLVEWRLVGETEVLGENLPQRHFVTNHTWPDPSSNPGRCSGKPATNRLSCGAAFADRNFFCFDFLND